MTAIKTLLNQVIDYAGLFPPAGLPMQDVVRNYAEYLPGPYRWMLARIIVPASRLDEFSSACQAHNLTQTKERWRISALIPAAEPGNDAFERALDAIVAFNRSTEFAKIDSVEGKLGAANLVDHTCNQIPERIHAFLEIPHEHPDEIISILGSIGRHNTFGKIRTGGVTPDLIPPPDRVAHFIHQCAKAGLGFKATAGLHHPLRGQYALTYEADSDQASMHGFMNLFLAACLARKRNGTPEQLVEVLTETDASSFQIGDATVVYRDESFTVDEIREVRNHFAISFGSCSFDEPVHELTELGWLADTAKTV